MNRRTPAFLAALAAALMPDASLPMFRPRTKGEKSPAPIAELKARAQAKRERRKARILARTGGA